MKKKLIFIISILCLIVIVAIIIAHEIYNKKEKSSLPIIPFVENAELNCMEIHYNNKIYLPYGIASGKQNLGIKIGNRIDGDEDDGIYIIKEFSADEWLADYMGGFMNNSAMIYKAIGVIVPEEMKRYAEYNYDENKAQINYQSGVYVQFSRAIQQEIPQYPTNIEKIEYKIVNTTGKNVEIVLIPKLEQLVPAYSNPLLSSMEWKKVEFIDKVGFCGTPDGIESEYIGEIDMSWYKELTPNRYRLTFTAYDGTIVTPAEFELY